MQYLPFAQSFLRKQESIARHARFAFWGTMDSRVRGSDGVGSLALAAVRDKRKPIILAALALALCLSINTASALTVSDPATHAKLAEEISKMQKMFEELQAQKKILEDQIAAIGKMGQIALPNLNLDKLTQSITKTIQCTLLDRNALQALLPGVNLEDVNISSVCQGRQLYQNALFGNPQEYDALSIKEKTQKNNQIQRRRENLYRDNMVKALALADVTLKETEELSQAVTNLESSASSAKTQNDRLAVIAQGTAVIARGIAQSNQMLALMLKNQTMEAITLYAPPQSDLATAAEAAASTGD